MLKSLLGVSLLLSTITVSAETAQSYCWQFTSKYSKSPNYRCYGPTQMTSSNFDEPEQALDYSGCTNPRSDQMFWGQGKKNGKWFSCGISVESGHNSPRKIRNWVNALK